jgi:hypothetical protein
MALAGRDDAPARRIFALTLSRLGGSRSYVNLRDPIAIDVHARKRAAVLVYAAALNDYFTGSNAPLKALAGLFAARLAELRGLDALDLYPFAATAQRNAVDRRAPLAGENGRCAKQERDAEDNRACAGEHSNILIAWRVPAEGNITCARKNGCTGRRKLSSAVFSPRDQGFHSTPKACWSTLWQRARPDELHLLLPANSAKGLPHVGVEARPVLERRVEDRFHADPLICPDSVKVSMSFDVPSSHAPSTPVAALLHVF